MSLEIMSDLSGFIELNGSFRLSFVIILRLFYRFVLPVQWMCPSLHKIIINTSVLVNRGIVGMLMWPLPLQNSNLTKCVHQVLSCKDNKEIAYEYDKLYCCPRTRNTNNDTIVVVTTIEINGLCHDESESTSE